MAHPGPSVLETPHAGDAVVGEAEEADLVDSHCPSGRLEALPRALMGAGASKSGDHR